MVRWSVVLVAFLVAAAVVPGTVAAHDPPDQRFDAPIPLWLLYAGAAATVGATAVILGSLAGRSAVGHAASLEPVRNPRRIVGRIPARVARLASTSLRVGFLGLFVLALVAGVVGPADPESNLATVLFWGAWLKGLALLSAVVGSPWSLLSPWETAYRGLRAAGQRLQQPRRLGDGGAGRTDTPSSAPATLHDGPATYPSWLGAWPALVGFVAVVGLADNLAALPSSPRLTAAFLAVYALVMLAGGLAFGREWFRRADFFAVFYGLFGRVAPLRVRTGTAPSRDGGTTADDRPDGGYRVELRAPWTGATDPVAGVPLVAVVVAAVYTVSFDGFAGTLQYQYLLVDVGVALGTGVGVEFVAYLAGYLLFLAGFLAVVAFARRLAGDAGSLGAAAGAFAPTVLPIAVAYDAAHSYPSVVRNAARVAYTFLPATGAAPDPLAWLGLPAFWGSQVLLVTLGHVVGVVAAHRVCRRRFDSPSALRRGHFPLALLMVGYTVLSLWIVSLPVVR